MDAKAVENSLIESLAINYSFMCFEKKKTYVWMER